MRKKTVKGSKPKSTGEKVRVRFYETWQGKVYRQRHQVLTVYETKDGTRCIKKMGRGCWTWYELDESGSVPSVGYQTNEHRVVFRMKR